MNKQPILPTLDRSKWTSGPWDTEPDRVDWVYAGYACIIQRGPMGAWCGYVGVPKGHPAYGKNYDQVEVRVHGGLIYADNCNEVVCHVPEKGMPADVWWLGFDCSHGWDVCPSIEHLMTGIGFGRITKRIYRDMSYATKEVRGLAEQLKEMEKN